MSSEGCVGDGGGRQYKQVSQVRVGSEGQVRREVEEGRKFKDKIIR